MDLDKLKQNFLDSRKDTVQAMIKTIQDEKNSEVYPTKAHADKIVCVVCDKSFSRKNKALHEQSQKHKRRLEYVYRYVFE